MTNKYLQIAVIVIVAVAAFFLLGKHANAPATTPTPQTMAPSPTPTSPEVIVDTPQPGDVITSPVTVKGRALNSWYFEANLPVILFDGNGNAIAQKGFHSVTDWMTPGFVDFNDTLTFPMPATQDGTLMIHNDNPSGDPVNDKVFTVSVKFW